MLLVEHVVHVVRSLYLEACARLDRVGRALGTVFYRSHWNEAGGTDGMHPLLGVERCARRDLEHPVGFEVRIL
jgi:hypothetical protein